MDGVPLHDCPFRVLTQRELDLGKWFSDWQAGRLPLDGGLLDQGSWYVSAMRYLEGEIADMMKPADKPKTKERTMEV